MNSRSLRVLLVDDHALVRAAIRGAISSAGVQVVGEAATGEDAVALAVEAQPDVILVDIDLPGMDGIQVVRELAPRLPNARIIMLTVSDSDRDAYEAIRAGAAGYLTKDMTPDALLRAVQAAGRGEFVMPGRMASTLVRRLARGHQGSGDGGDGSLRVLSSREHEVLGLLSEGMTDREIADSLTVSPRTIETHVSSILRKLNARNRSEAAAHYRSSRPGPNGLERAEDRTSSRH